MKQFADYSMRLALGVEGKNLKLSGLRIIVDAPARLRYIFNADGGYSFKSERNIISHRWWTTEESGSYSVNGDTLTITPQTSKATLRNLVLQPPAATSRDGILGSNSLFPNAYLYTQGDKLEWRF